jgi:plasmid replication initiation protein
MSFLFIKHGRTFMNHLSTITKHNHLVQASYKLSLTGQRVFLLILGKINHKKKLEDHYEVTAEEFSRMYNQSQKTAYRDLEKGLNELYNADIKLNDFELKILTRRRIVDEAKYHYGEGKISVSFPEKLHPFLCEMHGRYTQYRIGQVSSLKSAYAIRLFELLIQFESTGDRIITLKNFRDWFRIEKKYHRYADLNKWVIKPAIAELNAKTGLSINCSVIKKGRSVHTLSFSFKKTNRKTGETTQA